MGILLEVSWDVGAAVLSATTQESRTSSEIKVRVFCFQKHAKGTMDAVMTGNHCLDSKCRPIHMCIYIYIYI